jgi:DNA invertase Pin-like site-specific DNA recombinase
MTKIGYARVSTLEQELNLQIDALLKEGIKKENIFLDKVSGQKKERPGLDKCLSSLKSGDTLIVWRLDRLGRSMPHLVSVIENLRENGIYFKSICDGVIDTTTASGELIFNMFSSLAQFERRLIQERTKAGLTAARARGRLGGRPKMNPDDPKIKMAKKMFADKSISIGDICKTLNISRASLYRYQGMR